MSNNNDRDAAAPSRPALVGEAIPLSSYRLQFNRKFTFKEATAIVPYLHALGVSHCYASSYLKARPGSSHGYDIIDHHTLNPEIGTREEFDQYVAALAGTARVSHCRHARASSR